MNFFERQNEARSKSKFLVFLFACAVVGTFLAVHALVCAFWIAGVAPSEDDESVSGPIPWRVVAFNPTLILTDLGFVALLVGGGSFFKVCQLRSLGPDGVAEALSGRRVSRATKNPAEKRLLNVVEEVAIASGVRPPNVYVLEGEESINACAIGGDPNSSVVAVTDGALRLLNRDELQGVVAHEFSHILNGDTKINMRLIGVLFGLQMLALVGLTILRSTLYIRLGGSSRDEKGGGMAAIVAIWLFSLGLIVIGAIGVFFSNLIRSAISRQREFLADASAVQFTRNPSGIAGALKKIGCPNVGSGVSGTRSVEMAHLFFSGVFSGDFWNSLFQTHPPLDERIRRIDPTFDGVYPKTVRAEGVEFEAAVEPASTSAASSVRRSVVGAAVATEVLGAAAGFDGESSRTRSTSGADVADELVDSIGELTSQKLAVAAELTSSIPAALDEFLVDAPSARAIVYATLLDKNPAVRQTRLDVLRQTEAAGVAEKTAEAFEALGDAAPTTKLFIAQRAFPLLKTSSVADYRRFRQATIALCAAEGSLDLFEYTIQASILQDLDVYFRLSRGVRVRFARFDEIKASFAVAASYLAREGSDVPAEIEKAFADAARVFNWKSEPLPAEELSLGAFSRALNALAQSAPTLKRDLLTAFYRCVASDGVVTEREGALIYAISAALGAPAPIWKR